MIHFIETHAQGEHYARLVELRYRVLREPLGVARQDFVPVDTGLTFIVAVQDAQVIGVVALDPKPDQQAQLRQMAVTPEWQGKGLGKELVIRLERVAQAAGVNEIFLHAREHAVGFYEKLGYTVQGEGFSEVGIPHRLMTKRF